jgi:hypothetical protein
MGVIVTSRRHNVGLPKQKGQTTDGVLPFVGDAYCSPSLTRVHEPKPSSRLAVFPAPIEISRTAGAIILRTDLARARTH